MNRAVICDYCAQPAHLHHGVWGWKWVCTPCAAWVGTHANSPDHAPLGRLANAELRAWKMRAHEAFDPLWKDGGPLKRGEAYAILASRLGLTAEQAHIGMFDVDQCKAVVAAFPLKAGGIVIPPLGSMVGAATTGIGSAPAVMSEQEFLDSVEGLGPVSSSRSRATFKRQIAPASVPCRAPADVMKGAIVGKQYKPLPCACDALPWEICTGCIPQAQWLTERNLA